MFFDNPLGWYAFLAVIPLVILYLRRPKEVQRVVPSLMFFIRQQGLRQKYNFLRQLLQDILFLIQLLAVCALAFALTSPFVQVPAHSAGGSTVVVLDVSASMQASVGAETRLERGIGQLKPYLGGSNSVVLASNTPFIVLEDSGKSHALDVLSGVKPRDTVAALGDAMFQSRNLLGDGGGRVVVVSDFSFTEGTDPLVARRTLAASGIDVVFINPAEKGGNVGIVSLDVSRADSVAVVKNFNAEKEQVVLNLLSGGRVIKSEEKVILPNSVELFNFNTLEGTSELRVIAADDVLAVDNVAFISNPVKQISVLLVAKADVDIKAALSASPYVSVERADFPTVPSLDKFDIIIVDNASFDKDYSAFYRELESSVKAGKGVVITASSDTGKFGELLPVVLKGVVQNNTDLAVTSAPFTRHMMKERLSVQKYYASSLKEGYQVIIASFDGKPVVALRKYGSGTVVYYGIFDGLSNFRNSISYPIFWNELSGFLVNAENIADFNVKTSSVMAEDGVPLFLDKVGVYDVNGKVVAANLLDERESNLGYLSERVSEQRLTELEAVDELQDRSVEPFVVAFALLLVLLELVYVKFRGDL